MRKRLVLLLLALLIVSPPLLAQDVRGTLQEERSHYGDRLDAQQAAQVLNATAWRLKDFGFGLLRKETGNRCPQPVTGIFVSCDWLVNVKTGRGWDVLGDCVGPEGPGVCSVQFGGEGETFDDTRWVAPVATGHTEPPPPPPPTGSLKEVLEKLDALSIQVAELRASHEEHRQESRKALNAAKNVLRNWQTYVVVAAGIFAAEFRK